MSFLEAQQEILLDRVASVVENKIVLMSDVVLAANAVAAQQQINPNTNPIAYKKILESSRESMVEQLLIIEMAEQDSVEILDKETGISPGQACVFYSKDDVGDKVLGGGWINKTFNNNLST